MTESFKESPDKRVGFTSTIPIEILLAAGAVPVDLNNIFIGSPARNDFINEAEDIGFSRNICAWIKGLYSAVHQSDIKYLIGVTQGDCSNTGALMELLAHQGRKIFSFVYPPQKTQLSLTTSLEGLAHFLNTTLAEAESVRRKLIPLRENLARLDQMTWESGQVSGAENHNHLVAASDFNGDPDAFSDQLSEFLEEAEKRPPHRAKYRLGYIGGATHFRRSL